MNSVNGLKLFDGLYDGLGNVLDLRRAQLGVTAANLANANTPGYLAKEIRFDDLLGEVLQRGVTGRETNVVELASESIFELPAMPSSLDGNSVDAEREATLLAENRVMYQAVADGLSRRLAMLKYAATDGKS